MALVFCFAPLEKCSILAAMRTLLTTLHSKYIHPSLALPCLAAYCGEDCGELLIREYTIHQPKENLLAQILALDPDVVCFSVYVWNRQLSLELVSALKLANPELRVVLGGPEISFEPVEFFSSTAAAALICGEGERPLKHLLSAWQRGEEPDACAGMQLPGQSFAEVGCSLLEPLDLLPSPFAAGLVDLSRGYVYYESSRGCPYSCVFCMSALDERVRSFSLERISADLGLLMEREVAQVKFVDRTFNYDSRRCRRIIEYILQHNRSTRFHFEIGADLLDDELLDLLERVPPEMFQFEIGVQTVNKATLKLIERKSVLERLEANVCRLRDAGNIHLHLDLIGGLPGETLADFLASLRRVLALGAEHLQVELVKLLPGSPLREQAQELGVCFDPAPPYTVLKTPDMRYAELERVRGIGRLLDLLNNSGRFVNLLRAAQQAFGDAVGFYLQLELWWRNEGLFEEPLSLRGAFDALSRFATESVGTEQLRAGLARDYALAGRVVPGREPEFIEARLTSAEQERVKVRVKAELEGLKSGEKLQHFAMKLPGAEAGQLLVLYLYRSRSGVSPRVEEVFLDR